MDQLDEKREGRQEEEDYRSDGPYLVSHISLHRRITFGIVTLFPASLAETSDNA